MSWKTQSEIDLMPSDLREQYYEKQGLQSDGTRGHSNGEKLDKGMLAIFLSIAFVFSICVAGYNMYQSSHVFFVEMREHFPMLFYTNPIWLIFVLFISHKHIVPKIFSSVLLTFSLPLYASLVSIPLFVYFGAENFDFMMHTENIFRFSFGDEHIKMHSFLVFGHHDLSGLNYINGLLLIIGLPMLFKLYHDLIAKKGKQYNWYPIDLLKGFFIDIFVISFIYFSSFNLIAYSHSISDQFGLFVTWNVLLYPFLGIRIGLYNNKNLTCNKVGRAFSYYYTIFFMGLYSYVAFTNINLLKIDVLTDTVIYLPILTVCFVFYSIFNKQYKKK